MKRAVIAVTASIVTLCAAPALAQAEDQAAKIKQLEAQVAALQRRIAELEAELGAKTKLEPKIHVIAPAPEPPEEDKLALNQPLTDEQRAAVAKAAADVDRLAADVAKHDGHTSPTRHLAPDAVVGRWADASAKLAKLYAEYGQESACLTALARFGTWKDKSYGSQRTFDEAAYNCGSILARQWEKPESAMRLAARYGPKSKFKAAAWGKLCEDAAGATGKRAYKEIALRCYLRAAVAGNEQGAWQRARELEAELKDKP
ncbi:MAG: hypothetical protein ABIF82_00010 [Planctomycetota bacterium]